MNYKRGLDTVSQYWNLPSLGYPAHLAIDNQSLFPLRIGLNAIIPRWNTSRLGSPPSDPLILKLHATAAWAVRDSLHELILGAIS